VDLVELLRAREQLAQDDRRPAAGETSLATATGQNWPNPEPMPAM